MAQGLSVSRVVDVQVNFAPQAIPTQRFDTLLIMGDSGVIDTGEAVREYNSINDVAHDFGTTAPEYLAATLFFSQVPQPALCYIGAWAQAATKGRLTGGLLTSQQMLMSNWTSIVNGGFSVAIDGAAAVQVSNLSFSGASNLNGVATTIQTALRTAASAPTLTFVWNGTQFICQSGTTGLTSQVAFFGAPASGTNIAAQLMMSSATAIRSTPGIALETPVASIVRVDGRGWYAVTFAASRVLTDVEHLAISAYIEAASDKHMYGITTNEQTALDPVNTTDIGSQAMLADYMRTVIIWSLQSPYAISSFFGRALTVNFEGSNTTLTMKFKVAPGVIPEILSGAQATTLANKRYNVYVMYNNSAAITQEGVMSGRAYFDEMHGLDWLANRIQNDLFNVLYTSPKVPQTNPGVHVLVTTCDASLSQGVQNGLIAPGIWNAPGFGELHQGDPLHYGWYTFANNIDTQSQADREARIAPLIQIAAKLAGAIHFVDVLINVNR
jgi:uncharacterized protein DUF3383